MSFCPFRKAIADTPSFIFLWVGDGAGLEQGRQCLKKWGFRRCEDICWVKANKSNATPGLRHDSHTLFQHSKEHIHANIDTDVIIAEEPPYGLKRCGKSCRLSWLNYLSPKIKHGGLSEEDNIICSLYVSIGSRWSIIATQLPGRTGNDIKNYWNTRLKKKLLGKQRKEQQAQARRVSNMIKQDHQVKRETDQNFMVASANSGFNMSRAQTPYWSAEHSFPMPVSNASIIHESI